MAASTDTEGSRDLRGSANCLASPEVEGVWAAAFYVVLMVTAQEAQ